MIQKNVKIAVQLSKIFISIYIYYIYNWTTTGQPLDNHWTVVDSTNRYCPVTVQHLDRLNYNNISYLSKNWTVGQQFLIYPYIWAGEKFFGRYG